MDHLPQAICIEFRSGDREAFRCVIEHYQQRMYRLGLRMMGNPTDASDFAQDVFLRAFEKRHLYDPERPLEPWLIRLAVNLGRSRWRRKKNTEILPGPSFPEPQVPPNAERELIAHEQHERVWEAVNRLSPVYRDCLALRVGMGMALEEIAQTLKLPLGTVKSQLSRGLKRFVVEYQTLEGGKPLCTAKKSTMR